MSPIDPEKQEWEVLIVGTGMGGATLGYALARAGKKVLFCERGRTNVNSAAIKGCYAETAFDQPEAPQAKHRDILSRAGRWSEYIEDLSDTRPRSFIPFIGSGTGGSSALYGMALERLFPADFLPKNNYPNVLDSNLPERWPITYDQLRPYYEAAERLFRVRGTPDPRRGDQPSSYLAFPPLSPSGHELYEFLTQQGLHPYRLPLACEYVNGCECCQGYLCAKDCKNDSSRICLVPALTQFNAQILHECEVLKLEADRRSVTGVICLWRGRPIKLKASLVVLAAGALSSAAVLLNSASSSWPNGLANDSGLVGKNLMRHQIDLYVVFPKTTKQLSAFKELAFNDFYQVNGEKFGSVQSFGAMPPTAVMTAAMEQKLTEGGLPLAHVFFGMIRPIMNSVLKRIFSRNVILASILEDLPYTENQVLLRKSDGDERPALALKYRLTDYDKQRLKAFRKLVHKALRPYRVMVIKQAENNERIAHACGTCRFGTDPATSVLDPMNRAHGLTNLYVIDASFFPSSGGINPALTIAANAMRVADRLTGKL